jgi:hypothetical protein
MLLDLREKESVVPDNLRKLYESFKKALERIRDDVLPFSADKFRAIAELAHVFKRQAAAEEPGE